MQGQYLKIYNNGPDCKVSVQNMGFRNEKYTTEGIQSMQRNVHQRYTMKKTGSGAMRGVRDSDS